MKKRDKLVNDVIALLNRDKRGSLSADDIARALKVSGNSKKTLQKSLGFLLKSGELKRDAQGGYSLAKSDALVTGKLEVLRSGNGFVDAGGPSVFVSAADMGTAFPGDTVLVRLHPPGHRDARPDRGPSGKVVRVTVRARHDIVGTLATTGRFHYVIPIDPGYAHDLYVADTGGGRLNDRVLARFLEWPNRHVNPEAEIIEVLGPADDPSTDTLAIMRHFDLPDTFPDDVMRAGESASARMDTPGTREDLRAAHIVTIDPERARDFDDALSLDTLKDGTRRLGVHIADVAHFIEPGSVLDREAQKRGNSVYLPDKVIPMLPEQLSNGVCSLRPDEDRFAFSVFIDFDSEGAPTGQRFVKTQIRSSRRFTYEQAMATLAKKPAGEHPQVSAADRDLLRRLDALAQQVRQLRFKRFALDLDMPENEIRIGENGMISEIVAVENDRSHQLVEEFMVAANEAVARELWQRRKPNISRLHEPPSEEKIAELTLQLEEMGYAPGNLTDPKTLSKFLKSVVGDPLEMQVKVAVLRSLRRALYSAEEHGHFGLAKEHYAHFTSPIRRYPDLTTHRQLEAQLQDPEPGTRRQAYSRKELSAIAEHCTETEFAADEAERRLMEIKKYRYLEQQVARKSAEAHEAVVVAVMRFGLFVELVDLQVQGLVHISALPGGRAHYHHPGTIKSGKQSYGSGQRLTVRPERVNFDKRQIDFSLA